MSANAVAMNTHFKPNDTAMSAFHSLTDSAFHSLTDIKQ